MNIVRIIWSEDIFMLNSCQSASVNLPSECKPFLYTCYRFFLLKTLKLMCIQLKSMCKQKFKSNIFILKFAFATLLRCYISRTKMLVHLGCCNKCLRLFGL